MHPRSPKLLEDIRDAASYVQEVTAGIEFEKFQQDRLLRQAVERNFEILGEAVRRLGLTVAAMTAWTSSGSRTMPWPTATTCHHRA